MVLSNFTYYAYMKFYMLLLKVTMFSLIWRILSIYIFSHLQDSIKA